VAQKGVDPDESLVAALKAGDAASLDALVETYGTRLLRSATLLCGNETDAQDLVQDTFVEAVRSVHRFRGGSRLYTWLHSILLNLTRHHWRDNRRLVYDNALAAQEVSAAEERPEAQDLDAASAALARALRQLSESHREVLILRYYEHMKIPEIATHLGLSPGTVKSRMHYAILEMKKILPPEMNLFGPDGTKEKI
jgi:RNA polymerase sigma factor (sigma-70 family)